MIFWLSEQAKVLQEKFVNDYQLPTYAVFVVIAVATIVIGLTLGGVSIEHCVVHRNHLHTKHFQCLSYIVVNLLPRTLKSNSVVYVKSGN